MSGDREQQPTSAPTVLMPYGWRHPVTGRTAHLIDPLLARAGMHLRRARFFGGRSQVSLAAASGVSQSQISRFERALAPAMGVRHLVRLAEAAHPNLPLGYCPHEHLCRWQPVPMVRVAANARDDNPEYGRFWAALERARRDELEASVQQDSTAPLPEWPAD